MSVVKFGTDGWRAVISDDFTFDNVKKVAQAVADFINTDPAAQSPGLKSGMDAGGICSRRMESTGFQAGELHCKDLKVKQRKVVVGYDTRFLSDKYAELVACVLGANGVKTVLSDRPTPTPSVSFAIKDKGYIGGIMITASHNPARYNGIKYKMCYGGSADSKTTKKFEEYQGKTEIKYRPLDELKSEGLVEMDDIITPHLRFIASYADLKILKKSKLKVLVDSMYGTGDGYIAKFLKGGKCRVDTIHNEKNPGFGGINPEPILPNLKELAEKTKKGKYDIGLATDGDADRLGVALPNGKLLTGHKVMTLLLLHLLEDRAMRGGVVQTVCGTSLISKICAKHGLKTYETAVGFKYISELFMKEDILVGGEETGGVAFKNSIPERDGILSGLLILDMMAARKKKIPDILKSIEKEYGTYEYKRLDMKYPDDKKPKLMASLNSNPPKEVLGKQVVEINKKDGYKFICEDGSWLMLRLSGTEPILRVYSEAPTEKKAIRILNFGKGIADSI